MKINTLKDLLLVVDVQNDFITGSLAIKDAETIIPIINKYKEKLPMCVFTKDMHPKNHCSFIKKGGPWPPHCVKGTFGSELHKDINYNEKKDRVIEKGVKVEEDAYSAFADNELDSLIEECGIKRIFVCGLATEYCVKETVIGAMLYTNAEVYLLIDAIKPVNIELEDEYIAICEMIYDGSMLIKLDMLD